MTSEKTIDYKSFIEDLTKIEKKILLEKLVKGHDEFAELWGQTFARSKSLIKLNLWNPIKYSVIARAESEILKLGDKFGEKLKEEYSLEKGTHSGIGLDWEKIGEKFWIPSYFLGMVIFLNSKGTPVSIFSDDEKNSLIKNDGTIKKRKLVNAVLFKKNQNAKINSEYRLNLLLTSQKWRDTAKKYSLNLLNSVLENSTETRYIQDKYKPALKSLVYSYLSEVR